MKIKSRLIIKSLILLLIVLSFFPTCKKPEIPDFNVYIRVINLTDSIIDSLFIQHIIYPMYGNQPFDTINLVTYSKIETNNTTNYIHKDQIVANVQFRTQFNNKNYWGEWENPNPFSFVYGGYLQISWMRGGYYTFSIFECDTINNRIRVALEDYKNL